MRFRCKKVPHQGGVNRVRAMLQRPGVVAAWGDSGVVSVYDLAALYEEIAADASPEQSSSVVRKIPPRHTCKHREEGYALDWSPAEEGRLLSGDCAGTIQLSEPGAGGRWRVEREKRALARAQAQHRKKQRVRRTLHPPIQSGLPAVLDEPCVAVAPEVKKTDARVRAFEAVFLPKIASRANNKGRLERRSLNK